MVASTLLLLALPDLLIADFEAASYGRWKTEGSAFSSGPARGTLPGQKPVSGYAGAGLVNSFAGGDGPTGTLTSPVFRLERRYLNFLIGGGTYSGETCLNVLHQGKVIATTTGGSTTNQDPESLRRASFDLSKWIGKDLSIQVADRASGGWGHILVDDIWQSNRRIGELPTANPKPYGERYRPQFHFSAKKGWLNDPNGLVFAFGEYHLFYQHHPFGLQWGPMHWGHAVSKDLVHWRELPIALRPDALGPAFSGSAIVDYDNTAGFGKPNQPAMVAMFTSAGGASTQSLAYSLDKGRTWQTYAGNPVIPSLADGNRDPKVFWYEPRKCWIMAIYLSGNDFAIFRSQDLKKWTEQSRFSLPGTIECPELFEMPVEGSSEWKWVFFGANYRYVVGGFDGVKFTPDQVPITGDYGDSFYAAQTYNDEPNGRRVLVGWMARFAGPMLGMPFNQQMSFPRDLKLRKTSDGWRVTQSPVAEIRSLYRKTEQVSAMELVQKPLNLGVRGGQYDLDLTLRVEQSTVAIANIGGAEVVVDVAKKELRLMDRTAPLPIRAGRVHLRVLVDRSSIEVFAGEGEVTLTNYLTPKDRLCPVQLSLSRGKAQIVGLTARELATSWR